MKSFPALVAIGALALAAHGAHASLPVVNDDYAAARAAALHRHVPIFVEAWAPW